MAIVPLFSLATIPEAERDVVHGMRLEVHDLRVGLAHPHRAGELLREAPLTRLRPCVRLRRERNRNRLLAVVHHAALELEQQRIHHIVDHRARALARGGVLLRAAAALVRRAPIGPPLDIGHVPAVRAILLRQFLRADGHAVPLDKAPVGELRVRRRVHLDHPRAARADPAEGIRVEVGAALLVGVPVGDLLGAREVLAYGGVERARIRQGPGVLRDAAEAGAPRRGK